MDRTLNKSYAGRVCRSMTYVSSLSHGIWGKFLSALFCKYSTLSLLTGPQPSTNMCSGIKNIGLIIHSEYYMAAVRLRIWGVFNPPVTYGVTLWSGVWGGGLTLLGGRWALVRWRIMGACHRCKPTPFLTLKPLMLRERWKIIHIYEYPDLDRHIR